MTLEFVLGLQIAQLGIGQHDKGLRGAKNTMIFYGMAFRLLFLLYQLLD